MDRLKIVLLGLLALALPFTAAAQLSLPRADLPRVGSLADRLATDAGAILPRDLDALSRGQAARLLKSARIERLQLFARDHRDVIEMDRNDNPAVRGIVLATGVSEGEVAEATAAGYRVVTREAIEPFGFEVMRFQAPAGVRLSKALRELRRLAPDADLAPDHIHFPSGRDAVTNQTTALAGGLSGSAAIGLIDGGVGRHSALGPIRQQGFARGAPAASAHGTAVAALMTAKSSIASAAPGEGLLVADIYGSDPTGGSASALVRALGWMANNRVAVVNISLVGPENSLVERAIKAAQASGMVIVAAVGNDGPAAPVSYPASYFGVIAVTGVDNRGRLLPEAGRASQADFAAPGRDIYSADLGGGRSAVRGTSFASPLVAGRLGLHYPRPDISRVRAAVEALMREAEDLGKKGHDKRFGHGLLCGECGK